MRRREFIRLLSGAVVTWPSTAHAQKSAMPVVGILHSQTQETEAARLEVFEQGLREGGFVAGQNVTIENRFADGHNDRLPVLATDLVQRHVNVIFGNTTPPALAAKAATTTIPIVFVTGVDPVEIGLVASLNRPGANVTGVTFLSNKIGAKRLELLCNMVPGMAPIGLLAAEHNPNTPTDVRDALAAAHALGRTMHVALISPQGNVEGAVATLVQNKVGTLFVAPQADFRLWRQELLVLAARFALPTSFSSRDSVVAGGLMSYGPNQTDSYREAGLYTARILKGEKPANLPVMEATKFEFVVNLKTAKALDLTLPPSLIALATDVIE
jgi:putative tryptophan/tyrosine transport system substrate-binding protein